MNGDPCEREHAASECARDEHVERADTVRYGVGDEATKDGRGVEDGNKVKRERVAGARFEVGVGRDVEEGDVETYEAKEEAGGAENVGRLAKCGSIEQSAASGGQDTLAHDDVGEAER